MMMMMAAVVEVVVEVDRAEQQVRRASLRGETGSDAGPDR